VSTAGRTRRGFNRQHSSNETRTRLERELESEFDREKEKA
jgi:hypothetical protein